MKLAIINILLVLLLPLYSWAEYIMPGAVNVSTKRYQPKFSDFDSGEYKYKISWQGIPVASAVVRVNDPEDTGEWNVKAGTKTSDWISSFYTLKFDSESSFSKDSFKPRLFVSKQVENSKKKVKEVNFLNNGTIKADAYKNGKKEETIEFNSENQTLDPISAAFIARGLDIKIGSKKSFDVFNGKHRFLITFHVEDLEEVKVSKNKSVRCFRVKPEVEKLTDTEGEKRLRSAMIWITADDKRDIIKIESKVLIGAVKAEFIKFSPSKQITLVKAK